MKIEITDKIELTIATAPHEVLLEINDSFSNFTGKKCIKFGKFLLSFGVHDFPYWGTISEIVANWKVRICPNDVKITISNG